MAVRAGGDILETIETNFDISLVAASEHLDGDINASSSRTASWAGNIGFDRPQLTLTPYFPNTEPPGKTPLSDRTSEAGNSSSGNPDEALKLQRVPNPPSANGKSHLKRRHLPHVPFIISLKKRGKSTVQMISAHFQKASQMTPLLLNAWIPTKLMDTLLRILDRVNKCARQKADFLGNLYSISISFVRLIL